MNFKELLEGAEPKLPGAPKGISIMTPQQFVASAGDSKPEEEVDEGNVEHTPTGLKHTSTKDYPDYPGSKGKEFQQDIDRLNKSETGRLDKAFGVNWEPKGRRKEISGDPTGVTEQQLNEFLPLLALGARLFIAAAPKIAQVFGKVGQAGARGVGQAARTGTEIAAKNAGQIGMGAGAYEIGSSVADITKDITAKVGTALDENTIFDLATLAFKYSIPAGIVLAILYGGKKAIDSLFADPKTQPGVAEDFNGEYDDEAGMAQGNLYTIAQAAQGLLDTIDDRDNLPEWAQEKIAKVEGMLVTVWNYLQSQKAQGIDPEINEMYEAMDQLAEEMAIKNRVSKDLVWESFEALDDHMLYETAAWRRKEGKSKKGGLNAKGVASYRRENPGSKLQTAVTTKPSKLKPGSKAAKRRKSFCARMSGVKGPAKKPNGKPTRKTLALRKWNC